MRGTAHSPLPTGDPPPPQSICVSQRTGRQCSTSTGVGLAEERQGASPTQVTVRMRKPQPQGTAVMTSDTAGVPATST
jgi:hypothetical protein